MPKKKVFEVIKASRRNFDTVETGGRVRKFGKQGGFMLTDPGEAAELKQNHGQKGGDVIVIPLDGSMDTGVLHFTAKLPATMDGKFKGGA